MAMSAERKAHLMRFYDGTLLPDEIVDALSQDQHWFPARRIARGGEVRHFKPLPGGLPTLKIEDHGRVFDLYDFITTNAITSLMVLKDGKIAFETYQRGINRDTLWHSCSLAKSFSSTLVGIALAEGAIDSLDDPVTKYAPLEGGYRAVSVRQLLRMNSGISWNEDYGDPASGRRRLLEVQTRHETGAILHHMKNLPAAAAPGKAWAYNTGESYLVSAVMEGATGVKLSDYLSSRLWSRIGMASDARWWSESEDGMTISGSGMNATIGDYARFGQFMLDGGMCNGERLLPEGWVEEAGSPFDIDGKEIPYGYMWWIPELPDPVLKGSFQAEGIYGQYIHINPAHGIVAVVASARSKPSYVRRLEINDDAFFAALAKAL
jgi:CubicO group peptidase (beta-lactamase class C family)